MSVILAGTDNFRSLKGMVAHEGRRIAGHTVLRSDQLHQLDAEGWEVLRTLGVKTVCDLRSDGERERIPNRLPEELRQLAMAVTSDMRADKEISAMLAANPNVAGARGMMLEVYKRLPGMVAPHLPTLFGLFESGDVPVLIHCAAGKDRTGFTVAAILHALGVAQDVIVADYVLSARRLGGADDARRELMGRVIHNLMGQACSDETMEAMMDAHPDYLQTAYDNVERQYGSMDAYLRETAGLDEAALRRLRDRWLTAD
jgi:protein-tyrosine phosphatase